MKILFISSGYDRIYNHFEDWILRELRTKHEVIFFQINKGLPSLKSLTKSFKPEAAITLVGKELPIRMVQWLKSQQVKTAVWFTEDPYYMDQTAELSRNYDFVFTIDSAALELYKKIGHEHTYHLPLATEPQVFKPKDIKAQFRSDICFVGYPYPNRIQYIQFLLQNTTYHIKVVGTWKKPLISFRNNPNLVIYDGWVEPSIAADFYNSANIVLNTHRPFNIKENQNQLGIEGKTINNRTYDVAACESFQLIEFREDLPNHFIEDKEIISFRSDQELLKKIDHFIHFKEERQRIASNARNRVLKDHTFENRLEKMLTIMNNTFI